MESAVGEAGGLKGGMQRPRVSGAQASIRVRVRPGWVPCSDCCLGAQLTSFSFPPVPASHTQGILCSFYAPGWGSFRMRNPSVCLPSSYPPGLLGRVAFSSEKLFTHTKINK